MSGVKKLLQTLPLEDAQSDSSTALLEVRRAIALRRQSFMPGSFQGSEADRRSASDSLESQIRSLVEMYVSETPFAPKPWVPSAVPGPSPVRGGFCSGRLQTLHSRGRVVPLQNPIYAMVYEELFGKLLAACTHARGRWWPCPLLCCFVCCFVNCRGIYTDRSYPVFCVARRTSYKGQVKDLTCLPVDACTVPGILVLLAMLLPTASFGPEGVAESVSFMERLEQHMNMNQSVQLLPFAQAFKVDVRENKLPVEQIKAILPELGLTWSRWASRMFACVECQRRCGLCLSCRFAKRMTGSTIGIMMPFSVFLTTWLSPLNQAGGHRRLS